MSSRDTLVNVLPAPLRRGLSRAKKDVKGFVRSVSKPDVVCNHGIRVGMGSHVTPTIRQSLYNGTYEGGELKPLRMRLRPDDRVFEVGTGLGFITLYCAKIVGAANVFTYEANPRNESYIRGNFELNNLHPNLNIGMLTDHEEGEMTFYADDEFWSSSSVKRSDSVEEIRTPAISLRDELQRVKPTCLIVDIEGGEYDLFRDFEFDGIRMIVVELHPYVIGSEKVDAVRKKIESNGYKVCWSCDDDLHVLYMK